MQRLLAKIESIQTEVVYTSSESPVTEMPRTWRMVIEYDLAYDVFRYRCQYPHWVDLDAGEVKQIKGFHSFPGRTDRMVMSGLFD